MPAALLVMGGILWYLHETSKSRARWPLFVAALGILFLAYRNFPDGTVAVEWLGAKTGRPVRWTGLYAVAALSVIIAVVPNALRADRFADGTDSAVILFLGLLPLMNALADFGSTGLTRFCLRRGVDGSPWRWGLVDLAGGAIIFVLLVLAMMAVAAAVHWPDGTPLLDLAALFVDIRQDPGAYWWLYLTFLSTLLPTLLHAGLFLFATVFEMWPSLRTFLVEELRKGGEGSVISARISVTSLSLILTVALMLPIALFGFLIQYRGWVGTAVLDGFEAIARLTGMI